MAKPVTKAAWKIESPEELPEILARAFAFAVEGRPGPVLIDIPMDVQRMAVTPGPSSQNPPHPPATDLSSVRSALERLRDAERPLILIGGGIRSARAAEQLREFIALMDIPVVHSLMAVDVLPYDDPLRVGMIGTYGNRWANVALGNSDCLLVLGSRLDVRQTGADTAAFMKGRSVIHIDCEPGEINNRVSGCSALVSELPVFLAAAIQITPQIGFRPRASWHAAIGAWRSEWPDTSEQINLPGINPNDLMHRLSLRSGPAAAFVIDVGQHQMWAAQSLDLNADQRFLTSGGMGSMGFALPAALGAAVSSGKPVVVIAGDGGFQCNIQELQTVVRNGLPVKIVIINNRCHGMVRQFQESYFDARYQSTLWGYDAPDFASVARAYGMQGATVEREDEVDGAVRELWQDPQAPALLQVMVDTYANAYPKIAFGRPITEMEPFAKPIEMEST
jgi:acetolactate synthase-1/2/3 large subunit